MAKKKTPVVVPSIPLADIALGMVTVAETFKELLMAAATKYEFQFDLQAASDNLKKIGLPFSPKDIENAFLTFCGVLKTRNKRIRDMEVSHPSENVLVVAFTLRIFDGDELPLIDEGAAQQLMVGTDNWQKVVGARK